jgi:hypothetical protein
MQAKKMSVPIMVPLPGTGVAMTSS